VGRGLSPSALFVKQYSYLMKPEIDSRNIQQNQIKINIQDLYKIEERYPLDATIYLLL